MWIHDLFLDEFFPGHEPALALDDFQPGLNLVACGSTREAHEFQRQLGVLLASESAAHRTHGIASGTIGVRSGETLLEVSRIGLREARRGRHPRTSRDISIAAGDPLVGKSLTAKLEQLDARLWRALYTDTEGPLQRLATWWQLGLHEQLAAWPASKPRATPVNPPVAAPLVAVTPSAAPAAFPSAPIVERPRPQRTDWQHYHRQLEQRSDRHRTSAIYAAVPGASDESSSMMTLARHRSDFLAAKFRVTHISQQQRQLQHDLDELRCEVELAETAHRLLADWQLAQSAQRVVPPDHGAEATPEELRLLEKVDRHISQLRRHLHHCRQGMVTRTREVEQAQQSRCQQSIASARELLHDYLQLPSLALGSTDEEFHSAGDDLPWNLQRLIPRIRELSHARRAARQSITSLLLSNEASQRSKTCSISAPFAATTDALSESAQPAIDESSRRQSLLRQVEQLRAETRQLLARQTLSAHAMLGVGMLFSSSVAVFLAALLLHLDGAELATGAIGLIGMVASALLKASFERTPSHRLRQQRLRIDAILEEIQQLPPSTRPVSPDTATDECSDNNQATADVDELYAQYKRAWDETESAWIEFITELGATVDTSPRQLLRAMREHNQHCQEEQVRSTTTARHDHEQRCAEWRERANSWCCHHDVPISDSTSLEYLHGQLATALEHLIAGRAASGEESLVPATTVTRTAREEELQQQLRQAKRRRQRLLERHGVEDANELQQLLGVWEIYRQQRARVDEAHVNVANVLDNHPQSAALQQFLEANESLPRFLERASLRQQDLRRALQELGRELETCTATIAATTRYRASLLSTPNVDYLATSPSSDTSQDLRLISQLILWQLESREREVLDAAEQSWREQEAVAAARAVATLSPTTERSPIAFHVAAPAIHDIGPSHDARRPIPLRPLLRATAWLRTITGDKQLQFHWDGDDPIPRLALADEPPRSLRDLPARWQQVAVLSLQMALAKEHARRHGAFPWILTDRSLRVPQRAAQHLAQRLLELTADEQQIVLLATRPDTAALFAQQPVTSLALQPLARPAIAMTAHHDADTRPLEFPSSHLEEYSTAPPQDETLDTASPEAPLDEPAWTVAWADDEFDVPRRATVAMVEVAYERAG